MAKLSYYTFNYPDWDINSTAINPCAILNKFTSLLAEIK